MQEIVQTDMEIVATSLNELLMRDGASFVQLAYRLVLGREASKTEIAAKSRQVRGSFRKKQMLMQLAGSAEAREFAVKAAPLELALHLRVLQGLPASEITLFWKSLRGITMRMMSRLIRSRVAPAPPPPLVLSVRGQQIHAELLAAFDLEKHGRTKCIS